MTRIVADAGPLIVFGRTCGIKLIRSVVSEILVPPAVLAECSADTEKPGARAILSAVDSGLLTRLNAVDFTDTSREILLLDPGEQEAIAAAKFHGCPVLLDEVVGRAVARKSGIPVTGSLGVLLVAKERGMVEKIEPIVAEWRAANYYLGEKLVDAFLKRAGEKSYQPNQHAQCAHPKS